MKRLALTLPDDHWATVRKVAQDHGVDPMDVLRLAVWAYVFAFRSDLKPPPGLPPAKTKRAKT